MRIELEHITKRYGKKKALDGISLTFEGGMYGLLGRNGAGKSSLMRILAAISKESGGEIRREGLDAGNEAQIRKVTGYLPQDFMIYPGMTVTRAMNYLGALGGIPAKVRKERIRMLLERVNLSDVGNVRVKNLSGGMLRRLGIAQAMLADPKILIVDEPTAGLDPEERLRIRGLLAECSRDRLVILSTHIVGDIEQTCERTAVLDAGRLIFDGAVRDLAQRAREKVYEFAAKPKQLAKLKECYTIIGTRNQGSEVLVRAVGVRPPDTEYRLCEPGIEDGYMELLREVEV
ncbi:MAG TPA: ABC transporter ATP-binding protein [Candidatus Caccomorpha excrementavium]|nr:ABC transporter ATP-binding protein [Candidatus Caccomorpha excrementavium]